MGPAVIRVAVVGVGVMGEKHARVVAQSDRAQLAYVADPDEWSGRAVASRWGCPWRPEMDLAGVDVVVVAAPTELHLELALAAIDADVPVLVEKPVAPSLAHVEFVLDAAQKRDVPLMCGLVERFNPAVVTARALADAPVHVRSVRTLPHYARISTGVAWDLLIHQADIAVGLFGREPDSVATACGMFHPDSSAEDVADMVLSFGPGVASLSASKIGQHRSWSLDVVEPQQSIEADLVNWLVRVRRGETVSFPEMVTRREPLASQLDHFLDLVEGKADAAVERDSIRAAHRVVGRAMS